MSKIKICGLTSQADIDAANEFLPDYIGFVFAKSRRQISFDCAYALKARLNKRILTAGVFVDAQIDDIVQICKAGVIDIIQLHGSEDTAYISNIKKTAGLPVIKAVRVKSREQILLAQNTDCDYLLLDTFSKIKAGGTGECFDWQVIPPLKKPYFLAGGITLSNVFKALELCPYCLDISSGAETDGKKDKYKIKAFVRIVRSV